MKGTACGLEKEKSVLGDQEWPDQYGARAARAGLWWRQPYLMENRDKAEGKFHEAKGKVKEEAGDLTDNPKREAEGKAEKNSGKAQGRIGEVKKVLGK